MQSTTLESGRGQSKLAVFTAKDADTIISLSPSDESYILVRSDTLGNMHPFFKAGFSNSWSSNKLAKPVVIEGNNISYRYELEFDEDGGTSLIGKQEESPADERIQGINRAREAFRTSMNEKLLRGMFDENSLKLSLGNPRNRSSRALLWANYRETIVKTTYHLGFEMMFEDPTSSAWLQSDVFDGKVECNMLVVLKLIEFIHAYASFKKVGPRLERLILSPKIGEHIVEQYPFTLLRIAKLIQREELFRLALSHSVRDFDWPPEGDDSDSDSDSDDDDDDIHDSEDGQSTASRDDEGSVFAGTPAIKETGRDCNRYRHLEKQLGWDQGLAYCVIRMYTRLSDHYAALQRQMCEVEVEIGNFRAGHTARRVWNSWFDVMSKKTLRHQAINLRNIARGWLKPENFLNQYEMLFLGEEPLPQAQKSAVLDALRSILTAAILELQEAGVDKDDCELGMNKAGHWNLGAQFKNYRYPWRATQVKKTLLSDIIDMPNHEDDF